MLLGCTAILGIKISAPLYCLSSELSLATRDQYWKHEQHLSTVQTSIP